MMDIPIGYMKDQHGNLVPLDKVKEIDRLRDELVREIVAQAIVISDKLSAVKKTMMADIEAFVDLSAQKYDTHLGGTKGNITLMSYDGEYKVIRAMADRIYFDERLQVAKKLIDECTKEWTTDSRSEVKAIVNHAFRVDKQGKLNTEAILSLRRLDITDPKWLKAMDAISDSIQISGTKAYVRVYKRGADDSYQQINLDVAAL